MLETASIAGGAVAAIVLAFLVGIFVYLRKHSKKSEFEVESQQPICEKFWEIHQKGISLERRSLHASETLKINFWIFNLANLNYFLTLNSQRLKFDINCNLKTLKICDVSD